MSAPERPAIPVGSLTDKELEVLRLLTAGHTVKSIADRLGYSEYSINERLRDARRKTGIGSSRELARRLASQKIWDKNFDLSTQGSAPDAAAQHPQQVRNWSKGKLIMLLAISLAAAGLVMVAAQSNQPDALTQQAGTTVAGQVPLVVGKWSLDLTRLPPEDRPRRVTLDFRVSSGGEWTGMSDIVAADGSRQHAETIAAADGVPVPLTGNQPFADMVSMRQPAPNTLVLTFTKDGAQVSTRVYTVEADGQSMKETIIWAGDITPRMVTTYFNRVG